MMTAKWCDIFILFKYAVFRRKTWVLHPKWCVPFDSDDRFWFHATINEKIDIFFHSLLFLTLKYNFFRALPVTGQVRNYPQYTHQTFSYHKQKTVWLYLKSVARKVVLRFWHSKKKLPQNFPQQVHLSLKIPLWKQKITFVKITIVIYVDKKFVTFLSCLYWQGPRSTL